MTKTNEMEAKKEIVHFEVGQTINRGLVYTVVKRTAKTITIEYQGMLGGMVQSRKKIYEDEKAEFICNGDYVLFYANDAITDEAEEKQIEAKIEDYIVSPEAQEVALQSEEDFAGIIRFEVGKVYKNKNFYRVIERKITEYFDTILVVEEIDGRMYHQSFIHCIDGVETVKNLFKGETLNADSNFDLFDESILTPENTPIDFEDFTVEVYDDNEDNILNLDEDGLTPYFDDVREAIKYAKKEYFQTGLNVTVVQLNTSSKMFKNTDLPLYGIYSGEEMIYSKLEEVLQKIEIKKAESENPADIILYKIVCTIAYSEKIGNRKAINSIYNFVKEAEKKGFIDLAREVKFKTIIACWGDSLDNFYIEDYLKLLA